jgi:predicted nucleic acid-binding protein
MDVLIDASALMPILIDEPEKVNIINATKNCELLAPSVLPYEIGNALTRLKRRQIMDDKQIMTAYSDFTRIPLRLLEVDIENALRIACKYAIYAYDAYYLEMASRLGMPLLTLDRLMKEIALKLKLKVLEEENENI